jgi:integrase
MREEGKKVTEGYANIQRLNLETHVFTAKLNKMKLGDIKRGHILEFRTSLVAKNLKPATVNKIMAALKVVFREAKYREHILINPMDEVGNIKEIRDEDSFLTRSELNRLFPKDYLAIWKSEVAYVCFFLAVNAGMRRGEVLALKWGNIDFDNSRIHITEAFKDGKRPQ